MVSNLIGPCYTNKVMYTVNRVVSRKHCFISYDFPPVAMETIVSGEYVSLNMAGRCTSEALLQSSD